MNPILKENLQWTKWGEHYLLFNPSNRSTLRIQDIDRAWLETMDGSLSLAELEHTVPNPSHLLQVLERLCRGEFLANSDDIFSFLFPNQKRTQWTHQRSRSLFGALFERTIQWPLILPSPTLLFVLCIGLFLGGLGWMLIGEHSFALHPWAIHHNWVWGTLSAYAVVAVVLSVVGVVQMSLVKPFSPSVPFQVKHLFGVIHIGTARHMLFHTPVYIQRQFSGLGLGITLGSIGLCWMIESMTSSGVGASLASALMLLLLWQCCPFYDTDGAQLFETVSVHKQRLRTQDFLKSSALRSPFGDVAGQRELRFVLTAWLLWFAVAIQLLSSSVVPHLSTLMIQSIQQTHPLAMLWLGIVCASLVYYYVYFGVQGLKLSSQLLQQILPQRVKATTTSIQPDVIKNHAASLQDLGIAQVPLDAQLLNISENARLDTRFNGQGAWIVLSGDIALVEPKAEGGHNTLLHFPIPCLVHHSKVLEQPLILWGITETQFLYIPTSDIPEHAQRSLTTVQKQPIFTTLSPEWHWLLSIHSRHESCAAGSILLAKEDPTDAIYIVESGLFEVMNTDVRLPAGSIIGEMGILSEAPRSATIRCIEEGQVLVIPAYLIRLCLQRCPQFANTLHDLMVERQEGTI